MRILIISDHFPISPRTRNLRNTLKNMGHTVEIVAWNRNGKRNDEAFIRTIDQNISYGNKLKKFLYLPSFAIKLIKEIKDFSPDVVQAIDFEMMVVSSIVSKVIKDKINLVYEVFDIKFFSNKLINGIRERTEFRMLTKLDFIIFASPFFNDYYEVEEFKYIAIENKINHDLFSEKILVDEKNKINLVIGFVGTVRYPDVLKRLFIATVSSENLQIHIYGDGPDLQELREYVHSKKYNHVRFFGRYETRDLAKIYNEIDFVWACYPSNDENVKYAVSNKFYESQYFDKPILVSKDTLLGLHVEKLNLGIQVDPLNLSRMQSDLKFIKSYDKSKRSINKYQFTWESQDYTIREYYKLIEERVYEKKY